VLDARALAAWSLAGLLLALGTTNPVYRGLVALAALNVVLATARPGSRPRALLLPLGTAMAISVVLNLLLSHSGVHQLGPVTLESGVFGLGIALGLAASVLAVAPLSLALEPNQVLEALPAPLQGLGLAVSASLNLVPAIGRSYLAIREGQRMRGAQAGLRGLPEVLVPLFLTVLEDSVGMAEAMEARAYGSGPRTRFSESSWTWFDSVVVAVSAAAVVLFFAFPTPDWFPYPALSLPPIDVRQVAACLLLLTPGLRWR